GQEQLRTPRLRAHLFQEGFDPILRLDLLAGNHVRPRHEAFGVAAEVDIYTVSVYPFHDAADELPDAIAVGVHDLGPLCLAHLLYNDLLSLLGGNTPEGHRLHGLLHKAADL